MDNRFFTKGDFEKNVISIKQLGLSQSNLESLDTITNATSLKCNFLQWTSLRSAIPVFLRHKEDNVSNLETLGFYHNNTFFDASEARSKHYYNLLFQLKVTLQNGAKRLQDKFTFTREDLSEIYLLPINVCIETYLRDFQYKVLNYITCTNILL